MNKTIALRFEGNSGIQFEEHRSISQIPVVGSSDTSFGNRTFMGGAIVPATGAGNSHVKDIEMERLEVQMRKKKLMEVSCTKMLFFSIALCIILT